MLGFRKIQIYLVLASALIATLSWHLAFGRLGATLAKVLYGLGMWVAIVLSLKYVNNTYFDKMTRLSITTLACMTIVSLGIAILYPDNINTNKWMTLFANPFCLLTMIAPFFVYLSNINNALNYVKKFFILFLVLGIPFAFSSPMGYSWMIWLVPVFFPYIKNTYRVLCLLMITCCIITAFFYEDTSRTNLLLLFFCFFNYIMYYFYSVGKVKRKILKIYCLALIFVPLIYSIATLLEPNYSIFQIVLNWLSGQSSDSQLSVDTRSFLFSEIREDLTNTHSWLLGKGADGHYYSYFFELSNSGESSNRFVIEVTFLMLLFRGGIVYTVGYYSLLFHAVIKTLNHANNRFMLSCAVMIASWSFMTFISVFHGCDLLHVMLFAIVGCCCSSRWLAMDDKQIESIIR